MDRLEASRCDPKSERRVVNRILEVWRWDDLNHFEERGLAEVLVVRLL